MLKKYQNENTFTTIQHVKILKHAKKYQNENTFTTIHMLKY